MENFKLVESNRLRREGRKKVGAENVGQINLKLEDGEGKDRKEKFCGKNYEGGKRRKLNLNWIKIKNLLREKMINSLLV